MQHLHHTHSTAALVLAGGRSSRMGTDKAFLPWQDFTIIEFLVSRLKPVFDNIYVVTKEPDKFSGLSAHIILDRLPEYGSIIGLHSGLRDSASDLNFVIPCDTPLIPTPLILEMGAVATRFDAVVLGTGPDNIPSPLPGYYRKSVLPLIEEWIAQKEFRISGLLKACLSHVLPEEAWKYLDPDKHALINLNTRQEYREAYVLTGTAGRTCPPAGPPLAGRRVSEPRS